MRYVIHRKRGYYYFHNRREESYKSCIENKGAHIEEEQLDKIWDRFYRVDAARKRSQGGTGLGLAISKNILELHNAEWGKEYRRWCVILLLFTEKSVDNTIYAFLIYFHIIFT